MSHQTARVELEHLAHVAKDQGKVKIEAVCRLALARITELEAEVLRVRGNARLGAKTRMDRLTPAQRSLLASVAAKQRWHMKHASG